MDHPNDKLIVTRGRRDRMVSQLQQLRHCDAPIFLPVVAVLGSLQPMENQAPKKAEVAGEAPQEQVAVPDPAIVQDAETTDPQTPPVATEDQPPKT